jgi:hypothetical protein
LKREINLYKYSVDGQPIPGGRANVWTKFSHNLVGGRAGTREIMFRIANVFMTVAAVSTVVVLQPSASRADNGQVAAGVIGGLAVGTLFGAAMAQPRYYYAPAPVYVAPACYWTRGRPVWDDYRGVWVRPRIQVCD